MIMVRSRRRCPAIVLIVVLIALLTGCSGATSSPVAAVAPTTGVPSAGAGSPGAGPTATATEPGPTPTPSPTPAVTERLSPGLSASDRRAGLRSHTVPWKSSGRLHTVPGHSSAPGNGRIYTVQVQVESGLDVDGAAFARFVLATLNDPRSWTEHGRRRFARTASAHADIRVILAGPATSASICLPLRTFGKLSCRHGANEAVLTYYRWVKAIPEYAGNLEGYRHYVVNHEVGHVLGHGHQYCAGRGRLAPLMMQQTKGLKGCRPNPWPHP